MKFLPLRFGEGFKSIKISTGNWWVIIFIGAELWRKDFDRLSLTNDNAGCRM